MGYLAMCALSARARRCGSCVLPSPCPRGPAGFEPATLGLEGRPSDPAVSGAIRFQARTR